MAAPPLQHLPGLSVDDDAPRGVRVRGAVGDGVVDLDDIGATRPTRVTGLARVGDRLGAADNARIGDGVTGDRARAARLDPAFASQRGSAQRYHRAADRLDRVARNRHVELAPEHPQVSERLAKAQHTLELPGGGKHLAIEAHCSQPATVDQPLARIARSPPLARRRGPACPGNPSARASVACSTELAQFSSDAPAAAAGEGADGEGQDASADGGEPPCGSAGEWVLACDRVCHSGPPRGGRALSRRDSIPVWNLPDG